MLYTSGQAEWSFWMANFDTRAEQMLLSKATDIAFKLYILSFMHSLEIEPKTLTLLALYALLFELKECNDNKCNAY